MIFDAVLDALAFVFPVDCAGCGAPDRAVCGLCRQRLAPEVTRHRAGALEVASSLRYDAEVRRVILAYKEQGRTDCARLLAGALASSIDALSAAADIVVPVPSSRSAFSRRGFSPVELLLARGGYRAVKALETARESGSQKALDVAARVSSRVGMFAPARRLTGQRVLLVDDVLTTGSTLVDAARAINAAGGTVVGAATLAFTPRLFPVRDKRGEEDYGGGKGARMTAW